MKNWIFLCLFFCSASASATFNQRIAVQGYLKTGDQPLTTGSYSMRIAIKNNGVAVWTKSYTGVARVAVSEGMFTQILSGVDDTAVPFQSLLLNVSSSTHSIAMDVTVDIDHNGLGVGTDASYTNLDITASPLALLSHLATNFTQNGASAGQFLSWDQSSGAWVPTDLASSIPASSVGTSHVQDGAITTTKIEANAVTGAKIASGSIGSTHLAAGAVDLGTTAVTGTLSLTRGGTGATTAVGARAALSAAASGANSDITSLTGLTTSLSAPQGGTGQNVYATGDLLFAASSAALSRLPRGTAGQTLTMNGGAPTWEMGPRLTEANTWTATNEFNGGLAVGTAVTGGTALVQLKVCVGNLGSFNVLSSDGITQTLYCPGVSTAMGVHCAPTGAPNQSNAPVWVAFASATDTISIRVSSEDRSGTEIAAATWRCLVFQ